MFVENKSSDMEKIAELFKGLRFRHRIFGGVSETSVWRKLGDVHSEYKRLYEAQQIRYEAIIAEKDKRIAELEKKVSGSDG